MNRTSHPALFTLIAVLGLVLMVSCNDPTAPSTPTSDLISPTLIESTTHTPDSAAVAESNFQATLNSNQTQNAAYFATSAAMKTARPPTVTPSPRPTVTPTHRLTEIPLGEGSGVVVHGVLVHFADIETGLDGVDQIIDIVLAGNRSEFHQRVRFSTSACTHEMALGGPEKCREGEAEGTLVDVLPFLGAEGSHLRRDELSSWQGIDVAGLYAVYRVSDEAYSSKDYPAGEYGIAFRTKDPHTIVTFQVENGRILRVDSSFGTPPELNFDRDAAEIILPPPSVDSGCPGASPQRVIIGEQASVCTQSDDLIMRKGPGSDSDALRGIEPGTIFMITDGPSCANNWFWWKVELDSGLAGWVAEGGDNIDPYFICPLD
ncbi:MAG: SH3 domain-containing protein [Anaerolineales bacterium]